MEQQTTEVQAGRRGGMIKRAFGGYINAVGVGAAVVMMVNLGMGYVNSKASNKYAAMQNEVGRAQQSQVILRNLSIKMYQENDPKLNELIKQAGIKIEDNKAPSQSVNKK